MASANDSQNLKIFVAILASLLVILLVSTYFLYREMDEAQKSLAQTRSELQQAEQKRDANFGDFTKLRDRAGYQNFTAADPLLEQVTKDQDSLRDLLSTEVGVAIQAVERATNQGATGEEVDALRGNLQEALERFETESTQTPTFQGSMVTLAGIAAGQAKLATALALDNVALRRQLENVNVVNENELDAQEQAVAQVNQELAAEHQKYETIFNEARQQIESLQRQNAELIARNDELNDQLSDQKAEYDQNLAETSEQVRDLKQKLDKDTVILDNPDGFVTYVDYTTKQIRTNITRSMGARPQMIFSIFDEDAPGLPTDKPKARVMLIDVDERGSVAEIQEQLGDRTDVIRPGDQVYSAAWSPTEPERFALIGKIDMNRDGRDDRDDLKRLIRAAGGIVEYDLPPRTVGQEQGELTPRCSWYVVDERDPIRNPSNRRAVEEMSQAEQDFAARRTEVIQEARQFGVRPIRLERLLSSLGYSFQMAIPGTVEAADRAAIRDLTNPGGTSTPPPGSGEADMGAGADDFSNPSPF